MVPLHASNGGPSWTNIGFQRQDPGQFRGWSCFEIHCLFGSFFRNFQQRVPSPDPVLSFRQSLDFRSAFRIGYSKPR